MNDLLDRRTTQTGYLPLLQPTRARQDGAELTFTDAFGRTTTFTLPSAPLAAQALRSSHRDLQNTFDALRCLTCVTDFQGLRTGAAAYLSQA